MCGIAGWVDPSGALPDREVRLARMCDAIRHRGPDDHGYAFDGGVALGSRRLSIVDIAGGHQPMSSEGGDVTLVFNGEIFNHHELRRDLRTAGYHFHTSSDTEVILALYQREGLRAVQKLNGMFAIAIYDRREHKLHLIRDRLGVKPLYYHFDGGRLTFASEIKAIFAGGDVARDVNPQSLWDYLTYRFVPSERSIWKNIYKLPPAHHLTIGDDGHAPSIQRYWDIPAAGPRLCGSPKDIIEQFGELLGDAVKLRMLADVPVGILLSGGLDSSVVAAMAGRNSVQIKTFSVAFTDSPAIDEMPYARMVSTHLRTDHAEVFIGAKEFCDFLPNFVHFTDEPLADLASIPLYYVSKLARQDVKVVLSGEGSDEILGGYSFDIWMRRWESAKRQRGAWPRRIREMVATLAPSMAPTPLDVDLDLRQSAVPLTMTNYLSSDEKSRILRGHPRWTDSLDISRRELERLGDADVLDQALYVYCHDWLVEDLLMKADKMSMANSLELRTPFLDFRVVEYAALMPASLKVGPGDDGNYVTKRALREIAKNLVPDVVITRPKQGFPVPVYDWLGTKLRGWAEEILLEPSARLRDWFERSALVSTLEAGVRDDADMMDRHRLWNLLILELWMRRWQATGD